MSEINTLNGTIQDLVRQLEYMRVERDHNRAWAERNEALVEDLKNRAEHQGHGMFVASIELKKAREAQSIAEQNQARAEQKLEMARKAWEQYKHATVTGSPDGASWVFVDAAFRAVDARRRCRGSSSA